MLAICEQPNGERIPVERWVYEGVMNQTITDWLLIAPIRYAVKITIHW